MAVLKVSNGRMHDGQQGRSGHGDEKQTIFFPAANSIPIILSTINIMTEAPRLALKKRVFNAFILTPYILHNESTLVHSTVTQCASFTLCP
jgi:hypothetical protein